MLQHAKAAAELMLKRQADKDAEQKRQREQAEETLRQYLTCDSEHPEIVEKLADAATLLGLPHYVLLQEGAFGEQLARTFEELDTLEFQYREAVARQKEREDYWRGRPLRGRDDEELRRRELNGALTQVKMCAEAHDERFRRFSAAQRNWRYRREIPARYRLSLEQLLASSHPAVEMPVSELKRRIPLNLPDRPTLMSLAPEFDEAENEARDRVIQQATEKYEADSRKAIKEHEAAFKDAMQQREADQRGKAGKDRRANRRPSEGADHSEGAGRQPAADVGS